MQGGNNTSSLKNFAVIQKLGEGSFASVYKVQRIDDQKMYAMKKVKIGQMREKERDNALNEVRILASISHQNIVNYKEAFFDDTTQSLCIVMELADDGDIQKKINEHRSNHSYFTEREIWQALIQMSRGLKSLHDINILHRDLKCANVFCTKDNKYKIGDLNVSKVAKRGMARTQTGTPYYTSPEVWKDRPYDSKCDIWSLGCVIYEMASLQPPFRATNLKELYAKIQRGIFQRIPSFYSEQLYEMIKYCLKVNPNLRPSANQILSHQLVMKNMPSSQKYSVQPQMPNKSNLMNTIFCPRNLKSLKMALPGAKYEKQQIKEVISPQIRSKSVEMSKKNEISVKNVEKPPQIPRVINSPKFGAIGGVREIKYGIMRRPSSERLPIINKKQASSEVRDREVSRNNSRLSRNNSMQNVQKKKQDVSFQQRNRVNSVESQKKRPQSSRVAPQQQYYMRRNSSNKSIESNRNRQNSNGSIHNSRQKDRSVQRANNAKAFMEDISNQVKNIQERVRLARMGINNRMREDPRPQKPSDSYQKKYNLQPVSRQKRDNSIRSRNNSMEIRQAHHLLPSRPNSRGQIQRSQSRGQIQRSLSRNGSGQRIERQNSRKAIPSIPYRR